MCKIPSLSCQRPDLRAHLPAQIRQMTGVAPSAGFFAGSRAVLKLQIVPHTDTKIIEADREKR